MEPGAVLGPGRKAANDREDEFGRALFAALPADGVDVGGVRTTPERPTGVAFVTIDTAAQNTIVVASGANAALAPEDLDARAFRDAAVVLLQHEVPLATTRAGAQPSLPTAAAIEALLASADAERRPNGT